jgi:hypothetical protein
VKEGREYVHLLLIDRLFRWDDDDIPIVLGQPGYRDIPIVLGQPGYRDIPIVLGQHGYRNWI